MRGPGCDAGFPTGLRLTGVDTRTAVACMPWLDHFARVPPRTSPDFLDHVTRLCEEHGVTHVWPLSTEDQYLMALERANRLRHTVVIGSAAEVVAVANDKVRLYDACAAGGLPLPGTPHRPATPARCTTPPAPSATPTVPSS